LDAAKILKNIILPAIYYREGKSCYYDTYRKKLIEIIQRLCEVYRHCRNVVTGEKSAKNKKAYQDKHKAEYDLHDRTMQELQNLGITRIPSPEKIQKQLDALEEEKARVVKELQAQQKQQKTLQTVQANMRALLNGKALQRAMEHSDKNTPVL